MTTLAEKINAARAQQADLEKVIDILVEQRTRVLVEDGPGSAELPGINRDLAAKRQLKQDCADAAYFLATAPPTPPPQPTYHFDQGSAMKRLVELETKKAVLERKRDRLQADGNAPLSAQEETELDWLNSHIGAVKQFLRRYVPREEVA